MILICLLYILLKLENYIESLSKTVPVLLFDYESMTQEPAVVEIYGGRRITCYDLQIPPS